MKIDSAEYVLSALHARQFLRDGLPEIAFVGRSNVGKSSLLNRLLNRKGLARTGSTPGRTRAVNYFAITRPTAPRRFYFVDLPGYGFAKASKSERQRWAELMDQYFRDGQSSIEGPVNRRCLVQLVDAKVGATVLDVEGYDYFHEVGHRPVVVATKIDKLPRGRRAKQLKAIRQQLDMADDEIVPISAVTGEGIQELWKKLLQFLDGQQMTPQRSAERR